MQTFSQLPGLIVRSGSLVILIVALLITSARWVSAQGRNAFTAEREQMVTENIASEGVTNERVLDSMRTVPRHMFVRSELRRMAYLDQALDLGFKQTISPPSIVAYMTQTLDPQPTDAVLEIGTGSGYQAAVLSSLVKDVYTIEIVEPLGKRAAATLKMLDYKNVHCLIGDGYKGWPEHAPSSVRWPLLSGSANGTSRSSIFWRKRTASWSRRNSFPRCSSR